MARVTVEDCVVKIPNRFRLVMMAAQRSRELSVGADLTVDRDNDKNPVVALREIADETIELEALENSLVKGLQKNVDVDDPIDEVEEMLAVEEALGSLAEGGDQPEGDEQQDNPFAGTFDDEPDIDIDDDIDVDEEARKDE